MSAAESYPLALVLVRQIERDLTTASGNQVVPRRFWRDRSGRLLHTLDEVVRVILADDLQLADGRAE